MRRYSQRKKKVSGKEAAAQSRDSGLSDHSEDVISIKITCHKTTMKQTAIFYPRQGIGPLEDLKSAGNLGGLYFLPINNRRCPTISMYVCLPQVSVMCSLCYTGITQELHYVNLTLSGLYSYMNPTHILQTHFLQ